MEEAVPRFFDEDDAVVAFGRTQLQYVRALLVLVPVSSLIFGMALRLAVTYASRFCRDRWLYRVTVPFMFLLGAGSIATQIAALFQVVTAIVRRESPRALDRNPIDITGQVCATLMGILAQGFFVSRMWDLNKRFYEYAWGIIGSWTLFACSAPIRPRLLAYSKLFMESSGLLVFLFLTCGITQAVDQTSAVAGLAAFFVFLLFPLVAILSVLFSLVQRPPPPVTPRSTSTASAGKRTLSGFARSDVFSLSRLRCSGSKDVDDFPVVARDMAHPPLRAPRDALLPECSASLIRSEFDADDPQTWRGDAAHLFPELRLAPTQSRAVAGRATSSRPGTSGSARSASQEEGPRRRGELSVPVLARTGTPSSLRHSYSAPAVSTCAEYDEDAVNHEPTVMRLNLDALLSCEPLTWGPRARKVDAETACSNDDRPPSPSSSSSSGPVTVG
ncbi:hypothetical protein JCM10450v2_003752 [Rhodotorula kratochvilovae]